MQSSDSTILWLRAKHNAASRARRVPTREPLLPWQTNRINKKQNTVPSPEERRITNLQVNVKISPEDFSLLKKAAEKKWQTP
jgi:hypothetical protein